MYFVIKGTVSYFTYKEDTNIELELDDIKKLQNFGEIEMLLQRRIVYNIKIKSRICEMLVLKKEDFLKLSVNYRKHVKEFLALCIDNYNEFKTRHQNVLDFEMFEGGSFDDENYFNLKTVQSNQDNNQKLNNMYETIKEEEDENEQEQEHESENDLNNQEKISKKELTDKCNIDEIENLGILNGNKDNINFLNGIETKYTFKTQENNLKDSIDDSSYFKQKTDSLDKIKLNNSDINVKSDLYDDIKNDEEIKTDEEFKIKSEIHDMILDLNDISTFKKNKLLEKLDKIFEHNNIDDCIRLLNKLILKIEKLKEENKQNKEIINYVLKPTLSYSKTLRSEDTNLNMENEFSENLLKKNFYQ